jgi:hypothetical protein
MIIGENRTELDHALSDEQNVLLLLYGTTGSKAGRVHDFVENEDFAPWRKCFLLTDLNILTESEMAEWFEEDISDRYAVVGGAAEPKTTAKKGPVDDLLRTDGQPDIIKIDTAFAEGEQL